MEEIKYRLTGLVEDEYKFNYDFDFSSLDKGKIGLRYNHSFDLKKESSEFLVCLSASFIVEGVKLVENGIRVSFSVSPFDKAFILEDGKIKTEYSGLIETFVSIAIGSLRGILAKNLKGTPLDGCLLPLIPMAMIRENLSQS